MHFKQMQFLWKQYSHAHTDGKTLQTKFLVIKLNLPSSENKCTTICDVQLYFELGTHLQN